MMDNEYTMSNQTEENNRDPLDFHKQITVVDCHCDTLLDVMNKGRRLCNYSEEGHVDLVRLQQGGVNVQFFAAFIETVYKPFNALTRSLELINTFYRELDMCGGMLVHGYNTRQIRKSLKNDKIVAVLGIEGGEAGGKIFRPDLEPAKPDCRWCWRSSHWWRIDQIWPGSSAGDE